MACLRDLSIMRFSSPRHCRIVKCCLTASKMKEKETQVRPTQAIQMARFLSVAAVVERQRGFLFRMVTGGVFGLAFFAGTGAKAAIIS